MKLIIGGSHQGKKQYVTERFGIAEQEILCGEVCALDAFMTNARVTKAVNCFHIWVKRALQADIDVWMQVEGLLQENPSIIIIGNEIGCGIVPMDAFERRYREETGRIFCKLAKEADEVVRVTCGIGTQIK